MDIFHNFCCKNCNCKAGDGPLKIRQEHRIKSLPSSFAKSWPTSTLKCPSLMATFSSKSLPLQLLTATEIFLILARLTKLKIVTSKTGLILSRGSGYSGCSGNTFTGFVIKRSQSLKLPLMSSTSQSWLPLQCGFGFWNRIRFWFLPSTPHLTSYSCLSNVMWTP